MVTQGKSQVLYHAGILTWITNTYSSSGYIGFTTGTNDAYTVVKEYLKRNPKSKLRKSLKELKRLSQLDFGDSGRADTSKLDKHGYMKAWQHAACYDARFIQTQLDVGHAMYLKPAMKYAASVGVHSNLGKAFFYGTCVCVCVYLSFSIMRMWEFGHCWVHIRYHRII